MVSFPPFRLDTEQGRLWKGEAPLTLRRKPFAILRYLAERPGKLVTHDELIAEVWGGSVVSESAMRSHLHELPSCATSPRRPRRHRSTDSWSGATRNWRSCARHSTAREAAGDSSAS
jgi:hypothetical protein